MRRGLWREEGNHVRRGPFPPPVPEVVVRELSVQEEGPGYTYLKIEPLHAPAVVFETGSAEPTGASTPVPTPTRFEASALRYRFLAHDPADLARTSVVKEWTAKLRIKYHLHNRGDHFEVELLALPKAGSITIRYTTDGSSPTSVGTATYDGPFRVPTNCRVVCAIAVAPEYNLSSETLRIQIPQNGGAERPPIDLTHPARWTQQTKLDDSGAVWDIVRRLELAAGVIAHDISLTAESADGQQNVEYSGALDSGFDAPAMKAVAQKLQDIVSVGNLRMTVCSLAFPTGQGLLDWLKATQQPFNAAKVSQAVSLSGNPPSNQTAGH
ncbi:FN3 associated domain-containing protein [Roseateles sp. GG27B]